MADLNGAWTKLRSVSKRMLCAWCFLLCAFIGIGLGILLMVLFPSPDANITVLNACCKEARNGTCPGGYGLASGSNCGSLWSGSAGRVMTPDTQSYLVPPENVASINFYPVMYCPKDVTSCTYTYSVSAGSTTLWHGSLSTTNTEDVEALWYPVEETIGALAPTCPLNDKFLTGNYYLLPSFQLDDWESYVIQGSEGVDTGFTVHITSIDIQDPHNAMKLTATGRPLILPAMTLRAELQPAPWSIGLVLLILSIMGVSGGFAMILIFS